MKDLCVEVTKHCQIKFLKDPKNLGDILSFWVRGLSTDKMSDLFIFYRFRCSLNKISACIFVRMINQF